MRSYHEVVADLPAQFEGVTGHTGRKQAAVRVSEADLGALAIAQYLQHNTVPLDEGFQSHVIVNAKAL